MRGKQTRHTHPPQGRVAPAPQPTVAWLPARKESPLPTLPAIPENFQPTEKPERSAGYRPITHRMKDAGEPTRSSAGLSNRLALQSGQIVNSGSSPSRLFCCSTLGRGWRLSRVHQPREPPQDRWPGLEPRGQQPVAGRRGPPAAKPTGIRPTHLVTRVIRSSRGVGQYSVELFF